MKNIGKSISLVGLAFLAGGQLIQGMKPEEKGRAYVFKGRKADKMSWAKLEAMRSLIRTMITDLPILQSDEDQAIAAYITTNRAQLAAICALIQAPLFDPGTALAVLIMQRGLGNILYDIALANNYQKTLNWLIKQGLVNFVFRIKNDSDYEINVPGVARILPQDLSQQISTNAISFPMILQGYGEVWGKLITELRLNGDQLIQGLVDLRLPSNAVMGMIINLIGKVPPYVIELSYSRLEEEELKAKRRIKSSDPLDLFDLVMHHQLSKLSRSTRWSSYLTATEILSWPDVSRQQDRILNAIVLTKIPSGRYTRRDVYRYILNLTKDNYTVQDIQKSFDALVQEMGNKYIPGWSEYLVSQGLIAGPFAWLAMLTNVPINKNTVISVALRLLKKAYRNLMMDKGVAVPE